MPNLVRRRLGSLAAAFACVLLLVTSASASTIVSVNGVPVSGAPQERASTGGNSSTTTAHYVTDHLVLNWNYTYDCGNPRKTDFYQLTTLTRWLSRTNSNRMLDTTPNNERPYWYAGGEGEGCDAGLKHGRDQGWLATVGNPDSATFGADDKTPKVTWNLDNDGKDWPYMAKMGSASGLGAWSTARVLVKSTKKYLKPALCTRVIVFGSTDCAPYSMIPRF